MTAPSGFIRQNRGKKAEKAGRRAELWAVLWLCLKGYRIRARRRREKAGEIDIIARSPAGVWCFIEVKNRSDAATAVAAVSRNQRRRITMAAESFLARQKDRRGAVRFDVIAVGRGWPHHIRDVWQPGCW